MTLPPHFTAGFYGQTNTNIWSSDNWLLHEAGKALSDRGYPLPSKAKKSRGFSVRAESSTALFIIKFDKNLENLTVERN